MGPRLRTKYILFLGTEQPSSLRTDENKQLRESPEMNHGGAYLDGRWLPWQDPDEVFPKMRVPERRAQCLVL